MINTSAADELKSRTKGLALRRALYGGLLGSVGATAGWLIWIALQEGWTLVLVPVIAAALELIARGV